MFKLAKSFHKNTIYISGFNTVILRELFNARGSLVGLSLRLDINISQQRIIFQYVFIFCAVFTREGHIVSTEMVFCLTTS